MPVKVFDIHNLHDEGIDAQEAWQRPMDKNELISIVDM